MPDFREKEHKVFSKFITTKRAVSSGKKKKSPQHYRMGDLELNESVPLVDGVFTNSQCLLLTVL